MTNTSRDSSLDQMLAPSLSRETVAKMDGLLASNLTINKESHTINEWLGNFEPNTDRTLPVSLHAGFQAAAIASSIEESLFFLEQLSRYLGYLRTHIGYADKIMTLSELDGQEDQELFAKQIKEDQAFATQALYQACYVLNIIWKECILEQGNFHLNIPISCISGGATGFESTAKESQELVKQIASELLYLNAQKAKSFLAKKLKSPESLLESRNPIPQDGANNSKTSQESMIKVINEANQILVRVLPYVLGVEGIQQVAGATKAFQRTIEKWKVDDEITPPQLWSQNQITLVKKMQKTGIILCEWFEENMQMESRSSKRVLPLLSPRYHKEQPAETQQDMSALTLAPSLPHSRSIFSLFGTRKTNKSKFDLPEYFRDDAEKLRAVMAPLTQREIHLYNQTIQYIESLKGNRWKDLKNKIAECTSLSSLQQETEASSTFDLKLQ